MIQVPKNLPKNPIFMKTCAKCARQLQSDCYSPTKSPFYSDKLLPLCNDCIKEYLKEKNFDWKYVDKICQCADIPFIPKEFERLRTMNGDDVFPIYVKVFNAEEYEGIGWDYYFKQFMRLREINLIDEELPEIREKKYQKLREKWGANYDDEALLYLENLFKGLLTSQNVNGALQTDQAKKICKISLEVDSCIRGGSQGIDKLMSAYDRLVKTAEFTPKNTKNATDFDSVAELCLWLEKRGWVNKFYDDVTRDIVDETLKNIQSYNQRLYTNESSIGDEITQRISSLKNIQKVESYYDIDKDFDLDEYENEAFKELEDKDFNLNEDDKYGRDY